VEKEAKINFGDFDNFSLVRTIQFREMATPPDEAKMMTDPFCRQNMDSSSLMTSGVNLKKKKNFFFFFTDEGNQ
jgi:hypothetical protein